MNTDATLGIFSFSFQPNGKLESLSISGIPHLLDKSTRLVQMTPGWFYTPAGWDECFPTIEPPEDMLTAGATFRDWVRLGVER